MGESNVDTIMELFEGNEINRGIVADFSRFVDDFSSSVDEARGYLETENQRKGPSR